MWLPNRSPRSSGRLRPVDSSGKESIPIGKPANSGPTNSSNPRWSPRRPPKKRASNGPPRRTRPRDRNALRPPVSVASGPGGAGERSQARGVATGRGNRGTKAERQSFRRSGSVGAVSLPSAGALRRTQEQDLSQCAGTALLAASLLPLLGLSAGLLPARSSLGFGGRFALARRDR